MIVVVRTEIFNTKFCLPISLFVFNIIFLSFILFSIYSSNSSHASGLTHLYQNSAEKSNLQLDTYTDIHAVSYDNPDSPPEVNGDK